MNNKYKKLFLTIAFALALMLGLGLGKIDKSNAAGTCTYSLKMPAELDMAGNVNPEQWINKSGPANDKNGCDQYCNNDPNNVKDCKFTADATYSVTSNQNQTPAQQQAQANAQQAAQQQQAQLQAQQDAANKSTSPASPAGTADAASKSNASNASGSSSGGTISFPPPTNYTTLGQLLSAVAVALKNLVIPVAIIFIVAGGLMYMMSAGNETMIKRARASITGAVIGLAIVLAGPTFLREIQSITGVSISSELSSQLTIAQIAEKILSFLLSVLGIIAIISLVIGGMTYLTAYGNDKRIQSAKTMIQYSIIGIVVALGALVIVRQMMNFFK